ncbi:MAG: glycosyltransferase [Anaerolineae bacterium]|nr:glycosyltransferase [Anaerolineae bacterium]MDL1917431.1 glycosyltransferase [Anaerolineae bacterium CFX4]MEB2365498.1 glycosyltransferase [Chloroflexota bacterium]MCO6442881.1 glycosyltransferase [Anaerolineae bacterium]RIK23168.1 MAG: glycosyl transferase family 2 [Chloroflexota bacterium]
MTDPRVSIVIPAYNARRTIVDAVDSCLAQTFADFEIIVIDDGSTDDTAEWLTEHYPHEPRLRIIRQPNGGVSAARNAGILAARGEFVHFLDADDNLLPRKIERSLEIADSDPAIGVVYGPGQPVEDDGRTPIPFEYPELPSGDVLKHWLAGVMANGTYGVTPSVMVRRSLFDTVGLFSPIPTPTEDWDMWIRLAAVTQFGALKEVLVRYRRLDTGLSARKLAVALGRLRTIQRARALPEVQRLFPQGTLDRMEAGRWHTAALAYWKDGDRASAHDAFERACRLAPSASRRLYVWVSRYLPLWSANLLGSVLQLLRR